MNRLGLRQDVLKNCQWMQESLYIIKRPFLPHKVHAKTTDRPMEMQSIRYIYSWPCSNQEEYVFFSVYDGTADDTIWTAETEIYSGCEHVHVGSLSICI